ncbi:MAG: hypothetical protein IPL39_05305 [Opitutaceae bacterium]|nr:hypothetical protein [Opitutaceae bacterium]
MKRTKLAITVTTALLAAEMAAMDRDQTKKELAKLEPAKQAEASVSAMCYEMAAPPERIEYTCPVCAERTLYPFNAGVIDEDELATCRRLMQELPARVLASLDESAFCRKCHPGSTNPELVLVARYQDGQAESASGVRAADLELLTAVVAGQRPVDAPEVQASVLGKLKRLKELVTLGMAK